MSINQTMPRANLRLDNPRSVAIYDTYEDAQHAVDYLADHKFAVQKLMIVGTDLKSIERVTGALTWGKVLMGGVLSGVMWGMMLSVLLWIFMPGRSLVAIVGYGLVAGIVYGMLAQAVQYGFTRGKRDFASQTTVVATHYEVLGEVDVYQEARRLLGETAPINYPPTGSTGMLPAVRPVPPGQTDDVPHSIVVTSTEPMPEVAPEQAAAPAIPTYAPPDAPDMAPGPSPIVWRTPEDANVVNTSDDTDPGAARRAH